LNKKKKFLDFSLCKCLRTIFAYPFGSLSIEFKRVNNRFFV
jgi:hypothetical protein